MLYRLRTGVPWRDLPLVFGAWYRSLSSSAPVRHGSRRRMAQTIGGHALTRPCVALPRPPQCPKPPTSYLSTRPVPCPTAAYRLLR
ncbi:transposase [Nocardia terpenica]|uniref:Transposase n=1 Tax=Nocardia terpenica TaxID=455432 RepID=A0A6G9Z2U1_9NOCA|nr:transposase [Nocardia terpenica]